MQGTIKAVRTDRGFGFIQPQGGGADLFFHCHDMDESLAFDERLIELRVEFVVQASPKGSPAVNVRAAL